MSIVVFHLVFLLALVGCWLTISGRIAEWNWRDWGDSRFGWLFLGGFFSDLPNLKRFHFWLGWIILAAVLFVYLASIYHWSGR
jgi:hypothetical protein